MPSSTAGEVSDEYIDEVIYDACGVSVDRLLKCGRRVSRKGGHEETFGPGTYSYRYLNVASWPS